MKVLVTLNSLVLGGCQLNAIDLAQTARSHGVDSVLVGYRSTLPADGGPSMLDAAAERGAEIHVLDVSTRTSDAAPELARLADRIGADLVHGYGGWDLRAPFLGPCRWGRRPLVQTVYEMYVPSDVYPRQPLVVGTRYLLEEQQQARRGMVELVSPPVDLNTDHPGVDPTSFRSSFGLEAGRCNLVIVSRLDTEMKELGVRESIEAVGALGRDDIDLVIVGGGDAEERLRLAGEAVNARLGRRAIVFCGPLHDPRAAYAAADVVIGMGSSAARGLAFGKPLIVCGEYGWYRTFGPDTSSLLFRNSFWSDESEPESVDRLATQIAALADDPALRRERGELGRRFAEGHFGLELMAERLVDVYERAAATHRRSTWFQDLAVEARPALAWARRRLRGRA